jgi:hypothetical protein
MKTLGAVATIAVALIVPRAEALEVFQFTLAGSGFHLYNAYECPNTICTTPGYTFDWSGTVEVTTTSRADGIYTEDTLPSFSLASTRGGFTTDGYGQFAFSKPSATISGGEIVSLQATATSQEAAFYGQFAFSGLTASWDFGGCHHCGTEHATATLIPAIPEPQTAALMVGGLMLLLGRLSRSSRASGLSFRAPMRS